MRFSIPLKKTNGVRVKLNKFALTPLIFFLSLSLKAETYLGGGIGSSEFCAVENNSAYENTCRSGGLLLRANLGSELNDWIVTEGSLDALVNSLLPRRVSGSKEDRISMLTLGLHGFIRVPISEELKFFIGPSIATSLSRVAIRTPDWQNQNKYDAKVNTHFDAHYGWSAGVDFGKLNQQVIRLQWQSWQSVDSDAYGNLNAHYVSINFIRLY